LAHFTSEASNLHPPPPSPSSTSLAKYNLKKDDSCQFNVVALVKIERDYNPIKRTLRVKISLQLNGLKYYVSVRGSAENLTVEALVSKSLSFIFQFNI